MRFKKAQKILEKYNNEWKDHHIHLHGIRVMNHASKVCEILGINGEQKALIETAARYHDIGKVKYRLWMLLPNPFKNKKSTKKDIGLFKKHAKDGYNILKALYQDDSIATLVLHHHEKLDGSGFPKGAQGKEIPLGVRIITVCDAYDAMTEHYNLKTKEEAIKDLKEQSGKKLDKKVVNAFLKILEDENENNE